MRKQGFAGRSSAVYRCDVSGRYIGATWGARGTEATMLEFAILGLLQESSMHGYELRKELNAKLGAIRAAISYPTLRRLQAAGWITEAAEAAPAPGEVPPLTSKRGRVVYKITAEGKERFAELIAQAGPETYDDTGFGGRAPSGIGLAIAAEGTAIHHKSRSSSESRSETNATLVPSGETRG